MSDPTDANGWAIKMLDERTDRLVEKMDAEFNRLEGCIESVEKAAVLQDKITTKEIERVKEGSDLRIDALRRELMWAVGMLVVVGLGIAGIILR